VTSCMFPSKTPVALFLPRKMVILSLFSFMDRKDEKMSCIFLSCSWRAWEMHWDIFIDIFILAAKVQPDWCVSCRCAASSDTVIQDIKNHNNILSCLLKGYILPVLRILL
jgi:hypothetical protein